MVNNAIAETVRIQLREAATSWRTRSAVTVTALLLAIVALAGCGGGQTEIGENTSQEVAPLGLASLDDQGVNNSALDQSETDQVLSETGRASSQNDGVSQTVAVPTPTPAPVSDDTVQTLVGELRDDASKLDTEAAETATAELQTVLDDIAALHQQGGSSEEALAEGIAKRLGGEFTADTDLDELLAAVVDDLGLAPDASVDEVLAAVEGWANRGRIRIGGDGSGLGRVTELDPAQVLERIESQGIYVEALPGMVPIDLYSGDLAVTFDSGSRTLTATGQLPAPFDQAGTLGITWASGTPTPFFEVTKPQLGLAELLPDQVATASSISFSDVTLRLSTDGVSIAGGFDPTQIAGYGGLGLPAGSLPIETTLPGLGAFGAPTADTLAVELDFDLGTLDPYETWNTSRTGQLQLRIATAPTVTYHETVIANLGRDQLTFTGAVELGTDQAALTLTMADTWDAPFGATWLSISNAALEVVAGTGSSARISGDYLLANKTGQIELALASGVNGTTATTTFSIDSFGVADLDALSLAATGSSITPPGFTLPGDLLNLRNVTFSASFEPSSPATFAMSANTTVFGQSAEATVAVVPNGTGGTSLVTVFTPRDVSIASIVPALASDPIASSIRLPESAIVWTSSPIDAEASTLPLPLQTAFTAAYRTPNFVLDLQPGLSLAGAIPPGVDGIDDVRSMLGMTGNDPIILAGTLPPAVFGGGGNLADLELRALFPEVTPSGGPEWLVSGQVGLRITGQPSIGIVGALTLDLNGDIQTFEIEAAIAKTPTGVAVSLTGGHSRCRVRRNQPRDGSPNKLCLRSTE